VSAARCPTGAAGANECRESIRSTMSHQRGQWITVTTAIPPLSGFTSPRGYTCPHGITYWVHYPGGDGGAP
jgi:hypothetical protein